MGKFFKPITLDAVFSSSKDRTVVTARAVADPKSLKVTPVKDFDPLNVGYLSGEKKEDHPDVMGYFQDHPHSQIPMGESLNQFRQRTQPAIKKLLKFGMKSKNPLLAVVHSSVIHEVNHMLTGDHQQSLVKPGGVIAVHFHPQKGFHIKALLHPVTSGGGDSKYAG